MNSEMVSVEEAEAEPFLKDGVDEQQGGSIPPPVPGPGPPTYPPPPPPSSSSPPSRKFWLAVAGNCAATVGIVFINKHIFHTPSLRHAQVSLAAFHLAITAALLYILSRPRINFFTANPINTAQILPLALAMILNVVLPNASLANSSIQFYQVAKVLQTPAVALLNCVVCRVYISGRQGVALVPLCLGVAVVSYFDTVVAGRDSAGGGGGGDDGMMGETSAAGVAFALAGVLATALYTVCIGKYLAVLGCSSQQLLLNQAPVSVLLMLYVIPFADDVTVWTGVGASAWVLVGLSGIYACAIHLSQFFIIKEAGPVSSTVVGHFKNTSIVVLAWIASRKLPSGGSAVGILLAFGGMFWYSYVTLHQARK